MRKPAQQPSNKNNNHKRYLRSLWLPVLIIYVLIAPFFRRIFLYWWLIPLTCLIIYILIAASDLSTHSDIFHALLLPFLLKYWWIVIPALIIAIILLFLASNWAVTHEYLVQLKQEQKQHEQESKELQQRFKEENKY